mmetsp:Transcript_88584/g.268572  ORF Transcript_88584/g.268572 Transcript_88584/m.268572 type:complete len:372 (+) Transcript_88584:332-1447(+)
MHRIGPGTLGAPTDQRIASSRPRHPSRRLLQLCWRPLCGGCLAICCTGLVVVLGVQDLLDVLHHSLGRQLCVLRGQKPSAEQLHTAKLLEVVVALALKAVECLSKVSQLFLLRGDLHFEISAVTLQPAILLELCCVALGARNVPSAGWASANEPRRLHDTCSGLCRRERSDGSSLLAHVDGPARMWPQVLLLSLPLLQATSCRQRAPDASGPRWYGLALACLKGVIVAASRALPLPVALHPLQELEVVLVLRSDETVNIHVPLDMVLVEGRLQHLVIWYEFVVNLGIPVDLAHGDGVRMTGVDNLAIDSPIGALLHLGQVYLQEPIDPLQQVAPRHKECTLHHADGGGRATHATGGRHGGKHCLSCPPPLS